MRFNPPPGWPVGPGFSPGPDWEPDPLWPPAPAQWRFWTPDSAEPTRPSSTKPREEPLTTAGGGRLRLVITGVIIVAVAAAGVAILAGTGILTRDEPAGADAATAPMPPPADRPLSTPTDPETASYAQLAQIAARDRLFVSDRLADVWVPQLSSKRPGIVDEGLVWNHSLTLREHLRLRQRYDAKLLLSGDWSTFDAPDFWVTIVPQTFGDPDGALRWCTREGFDPLHCYAKLVSTTHPVRGSTAHNK